MGYGTHSGQRADVVRGLRELADLLESTSAVPLPANDVWVMVLTPSQMNEAEGRSEVDRVAGVLGTCAAFSDGYYKTELRLGRVRYEFCHVPPSKRPRIGELP